MLIGAAAVSKLGNTFLTLATLWTMLATTGSPLLAALGFGVQNVPYFFSPVLGGLVDRYDRRQVFLVSEVTQAVGVASLPLLLMAHQVVLSLLLLTALGCGGVVSNLTSDFYLVPALSSPDRLSEAYSKYSAVTSLAYCIGPAVAGGVVAGCGPYVALWIDAATFLTTALAAVRLPVRSESAREQNFFRMLSAGFLGFRRAPGIPRLTIALTLYNFGAGSVPALIVVMARRAWGWSPGVAGLALAAGVAGGVFGSWLGPRLLAHSSIERRISRWLQLCLGACALLLLPWPPSVIAGLFLLMGAEGGINVTTNEYRIRVIPSELAGRTNSIVRAPVLGAVALSSVVLGWSVTLPVSELWFVPAVLGTAAASAVWGTGKRRLPQAMDNQEAHP